MYIVTFPPMSVFTKHVVLDIYFKFVFKWFMIS